jgi:hypothetical protein
MLTKIKEALWGFFNWLAEALTEEQATIIGVATLMSGWAFYEIIGPWFAVPFFFLGSFLLVFDFHGLVKETEEFSTVVMEKTVVLNPEDYTWGEDVEPQLLT